MSSELTSALASWLSNSWRFFTEVTIPGTSITFAVLAIGLIIVPIGFQFLSIMTGHNIGEAGGVVSRYGALKTKIKKISDERKNDTR